MKTNELKQGWNLCKRFDGDSEKLVAFLEIQRLNRRAANAWTRGNNSGNSEYMNTCNVKAEKAWNKAQGIAEKQGWKIKAPGLYWTVSDKQGEIRI
jgi:hypothetical protein